MGEFDSVVIPFEADLSGFAALGAVLGGIAGDAGDKAAAALQTGFQIAEKGVKTSVKGAEKAVKTSMEVIEKSVKHAGDAFKTVGDSAEKVGKLPIPGFQMLGNTIKNVTEGMGALLTPTGLLLGGVMLVGDAFVAAAASGAVFSLAMIGLIEKSRDLLKTLEPFKSTKLAFDDDDTKKLKRADDALDAVTLTLGALGLRIATWVAPAVTELATVFVAFGLAAVDGLNHLAENADYVFGQMITTMFAPFMNSLFGMLRALELASGVLGVDLPFDLKTLRKEWDATVAGFGHDAFKAIGASVDYLNSSLGDYYDQAVKIIDIQGEVTDSADKEVINVERAADKMRIAYQGVGKALTDSLADVDADLDRLNKSAMDGAKTMRNEFTSVGKAMVASTDKAHDALDRYIDSLDTLPEMVDKAGKSFGMLAEGVTKLINVESERYKHMGKEGRQNLEALWEMQQGISIAQIIAAGAVAAVQAYAQLGPLGGTFAAAGIVAGVVGESLATVRQTKPEFDIGTAYAEPYPGQSDQFTATLSRGEAVLTRRAAEQIGRDTIDKANAGVRDSGAQSVTINFRGRTIDRMMSETIRSGGATAAMLLNPSGRSKLYV